MNTKANTITGIGSVTPFGPLAGLIPETLLELSTITAWPTDGLRRAFLVKPFQPSSIVPGLKTRRLDRLSGWAVVAASLALQDAGVDLEQIDRSRVAVVFGTGFSCIELAEAFYKSAYGNGWAGTDPITFPETLANSPAGHVALFHGLRGPNITVSNKHFSGETALLQAASLLRHGQADLVVVIAGDTVTQTSYAWYETARVLSPACYNAEPLQEAGGYIPSEGIVALVLEPAGKREIHPYIHLHAGRCVRGGDPVEGVREIVGDKILKTTLRAGDGAPCSISSAATDAACNTIAPQATAIPAQAIALGLSDAGGLLHLALALSRKPEAGPALMLATSRDEGFAALLLEIPNRWKRTQDLP